jgi:surface protein
MKITQTTLALLLLHDAMADKAGKVRSKEPKGKKGKGKSGKGSAAPTRASTDGPTAAPSRAPCTSANSFNTTSLQSAVSDYFGQGCLTNNTCAIIIKYGDIGGWKTCEVTNMGGLFTTNINPQAAAFNQPLNNWDVSKVTNMNGMFFGAAAFNQPLKDWDVSKVTDMRGMFIGASSFNQNLCAWGKVASFPYSAALFMFTNSGCTYKADPTQATKGPFCADDCTALFV